MKTTLTAIDIALTIGIATGAKAQNWMYSHGPGGTPPAMYNTPYAPQNQQWGNSYQAPSYNNNQPFQAPPLPQVPCVNRDPYGRPLC